MALFRTTYFFVLILSLFFLPSLGSVSPFYSLYGFGDSTSTVDHVAANLGLSPPQFYTEKGVEFESGVSFVSPEAMVMNPFFFVKNGIPPPQQSHHSQINTFMGFFYKDCFAFHDCGRNKVVQKAMIFMDQPGFNDYKHAFLDGKLSIHEVSKLVPDVVETIKNSVERLINDAGAKHLLVSGILPVGCLPGFRTMFPESDSQIKCHKGLNLFSRLHNDHLWQALEELRLKYPDVDITYADYYKGYLDILRQHGSKACSGEDGFRLTPGVSKNLMDTIFSGKGLVFPEFKYGTAAARRRVPKIITLFRNGLRDILYGQGGEIAVA